MYGGRRRRLPELERWLGAFAKKMGTCSSTRAELRAVLRGLLIAKERGFKKLVVTVDSITTIVGLLKGHGVQW